MKRRQFLGVLATAMAVRPIISHAQRGPVRIGLLSSGANGSRVSNSQVLAIHEGLRSQGLQEGRDYLLDARFSAGKYEQFPEMARELARLGARVILVNTIASARAAQTLDPPVPVVMLSINDPVGTGLIASLARPGGHTTGMATLNEDLTSKLLELLRGIVPKAATIAALFNPANPTNLLFVDDLRSRAGSIGIAVQPVELRSPDQLDAAFAKLATMRPDALQLISDSGIFDVSDRIAALALAHRLPSIATAPGFAELGGLMAYGAVREKLFAQSAYFVKKILDGANPGELPVQQPTGIEFWINLKTAAALGLEIPLHYQQIADRIFE